MYHISELKKHQKHVVLEEEPTSVLFKHVHNTRIQLLYGNVQNITLLQIKLTLAVRRCQGLMVDVVCYMHYMYM